jgi:catechol 2,3-dioxygenase-like lactoylglutathione lyase family enzyme
MPNVRIGSITLFVKDLDKLTAFYRDGLGLPMLLSEGAPGDLVCLDGVAPEGNVFQIANA